MGQAMTPKQFVAKQLALPGPDRVIPDRMYMWDNRTDDFQRLREGRFPYNARHVFNPRLYYEDAYYFGPNGPGRHKYYPNGVFSI